MHFSTSSADVAGARCACSMDLYLRTCFCNHSSLLGREQNNSCQISGFVYAAYAMTVMAEMRTLVLFTKNFQLQKLVPAMPNSPERWTCAL